MLLTPVLHIRSQAIVTSYSIKSAARQLAADLPYPPGFGISDPATRALAHSGTCEEMIFRMLEPTTLLVSSHSQLNLQSDRVLKPSSTLAAEDQR